MQGIDDVDVQVDTSPSVSEAERVVRGALGGPLQDIREGGHVVSSAGDPQPYSDYDPKWVPWVHLMSFPFGDGGCPHGMSFPAWCKIILNRFPREQFAQNVPMVLDMLNIQMRHQVNVGTKVSLKMSPAMMEQIGTINDETIQQVLQILRKGPQVMAKELRKGPQVMAKELRQPSTPPAVQLLLKSMAISGARVPGTPRRLRSETLAMWHMGGVWTTSITLNPSDLNAGVLFEVCGHGYSYIAQTGAPVLSPVIADKFKIIASNPVACAEYFRAVVVGFIEVFLGWKEGAKSQTNPDCIFGRVTALMSSR